MNSDNNNFFDDHINQERSSDIEEDLTEIDTDHESNLDTDDSSPTIFDDALTERLTLPADLQLAIKKLLKRGIVEIDKHKKIFDTLVHYQDEAVVFLANLGITLTIDERDGLIFTAEVSDLDDDSDSGTLIHKRPLNLYETFALLVIRKHYQEKQLAGEQLITIDIEQVSSMIMPFLPQSNSETADLSKLSTCLSNLAKRHVLKRIPGEGERYKISPIIRHLASPETFEQLTKDYLELAREASGEVHIVPRTDTLTEQESQESSQQSPLGEMQ